MNHKVVELPAGLYVVATPLGNIRDITLRALDVLASADVLAAEDTRSLRRLLDVYGITLGDRALLAYHDHSSAKDRERLMNLVASGASVALMSEAGTPLINDPGFKLVSALQDGGHTVVSVPGPSAATAALSIGGLPTDRFLYLGFMAPKQSARRKALEDAKSSDATLVIYESPRRIAALLDDIVATFGPDTPVSLCRELTKKFEEVRKSTASRLAADLAETPVKGEIVLLVAPNKDTEAMSDDTIQEALVKAMLTMRMKDAVQSVAGAYDLPRRQVYQLALDLKDKE